MKIRSILALACLISSASAQDLLDALNPFIATKVTTYASGDMDFKNGAGQLSSYQIEARSLISKPIELPGDFLLFPVLDYQATFLRYDRTPLGFPVNDEDLHSISLPLYAVHLSKESPWLWGVYAAPAISTDFDHIDGDDFFFNVGVGAGYRFSKDFVVGAGVGYFDVTGDATFMPGIGVLWKPTDCLTIELLGPMFSATYHAGSEWRFGFDVRSEGGTWNIDSNNASRTLELRSLRAGLSAQRHLAENWWLEAGAGLTFLNKVELRTHSGLGLDEAQLDRLDEGPYGYLSIKREIW